MEDIFGNQQPPVQVTDNSVSTDISDIPKPVGEDSSSQSQLMNTGQASLVNPSSADISYEDMLRKDILELLGQDDLPEEEKNELYKKMLDTIQNRALMNVLDLLPDEKRDEFNERLDNQNPAEINQFLEESGIDMEKIMLEESIIYKAELVELQKSAQKSE
jgi:hypothetical protein